MFESLDGENRRAWDAYPHVCSRFAMATRTSDVVLSHLTSQDEPDEAMSLVQRLAVLFHLLNPPQKVKTHGA